MVAVPYEIWGINLENGKLRWYCEALESEQINASVVVHDDVIYAVAGRGGGSIAVRVGGRGDVTESHVVWTGREQGRFASPVVHNGRMYVASNVISCIDTKTGRREFRQRLEGGSARQQDPEGRGPGRRRGFGGRFGGGGGSDYPSPVAADGKLYCLRGSGETFVLKLGDKLEELAVNRVTEDSESFGGTPAISDGRLFLRSNKHLYCVAKTN